MEKIFKEQFNNNFLESIQIVIEKSNEKINNHQLLNELNLINIHSDERNLIGKNKFYFKYLSFNPNISWDIVRNNQNLDWNFKLLSINENINNDIIKNNDFYKWNLEVFASNKNFTPNVKQLIDGKQSSFYFSTNDKFNIDYFNILVNKCELDWFSLSSKSFLNFDLVKKYKNNKWNWIELSENVNVINKSTIDRLSELENIQIDYLFANASFDYHFLINFFSGYFNYQNYSKNKNISWDVVFSNPLENWNWENLSSNESLTWDLISKNLNFPWLWSELSKNNCINLNIINNFKSLPWTWESLSCNKNIDPFFIIKNKEKNWEISNLIFNDMSNSKKLFVTDKLISYTKSLLHKLLPNEIIIDICDFY